MASPLHPCTPQVSFYLKDKIEHQENIKTTQPSEAKLQKLKVTKCYGHILSHPKAAEARVSEEKAIFSSTDTNSKIGKPDCGVQPLGLQAHMATAIISTQFTSPHTGKRMDLERKNTA